MRRKLALYRTLFTGRDNVHALRWDNARTGKAGWVPAVEGGWRKQGPRKYLPLTDDVEICPCLEAAAKGAAASGHPWLSLLASDEAAGLARNAGYDDVDVVTSADPYDRYFADRRRRPEPCRWRRPGDCHRQPGMIRRPAAGPKPSLPPTFDKVEIVAARDRN